MVMYLECGKDGILCPNYGYTCKPKSQFGKCDDGPYKGQCVSRTQLCDNFNVCGGRSLQKECCKLLRGRSVAVGILDELYVALYFKY